MPAGSEPALPRTYRPLGVRVAAVVLGALLVAATATIWFAFPPEVRAQFTTFQRVTVLALGGSFYAAGFALARSRLVARSDGITVVNGYRRRHYQWNEVLGVSLRGGSPWAVLDLSDGTSVPAMGIQGSDGARATRQVREIRGLVERLTR
ncbi:MAG: PH domain-containing protein [Nocardioidaceae bacterium]